MEKVNAKEISLLLKSQIEAYSKELETSEVGRVVSVGDSIATVYGLDNAMSNELLAFDIGVFGIALNLERETVGVILLNDNGKIRIKRSQIVA